MIILLFLFIIIIFSGFKYNSKGYCDYLDKSQTNAIRGIFAIIIFFNHFGTYLPNLGTGFGDNIYYKIITTIGQLMVAPFIFYSGYGIYVSAKKKGKDYITHFPKRRILKVFIFFAAAVLLFLILAFIRGNKYSPLHIILAFTGWTSLGNSNWFIFAILILYIITYFCALFTKKEICLKTILCITLLSIVYILVVNRLKDGATYWVDTILTFSGGMLYANYKEKIDKVLKTKYLPCLFGSILVFTILYIAKMRVSGIAYLFTYNLLAITFCVVISFITHHIRISNTILQFCGTYGFEIYILQRIPDSLLQPLLSGQTIIFFIVSLSATIVISFVFKKVTTIIDKKLLSAHPRQK